MFGYQGLNQRLLEDSDDELELDEVPRMSTDSKRNGSHKTGFMSMPTFNAQRNQVINS